MKKILALIISAVLIMTCIPIFASAETVYILKNNIDKFKTQGRTSFVNDVLMIDYTASGIEFEANCQGDVYVEFDTLSIRDSADIGGCYFTIIVDGVKKDRDFCHITDVGKTNFCIAQGLSSGKHTFAIYRQTEIEHSEIGISSIALSGDLLNAPEEKDLYIEFIGDSISTGYGNLTTGTTNASKPIYQDGTQAFPYLVAEGLNADFSVVARQGIGIKYGYQSIGMLTVYPLLRHMRDSKTEYDFVRQPDIVVLALGTNDTAFGESDANIKKSFIDMINLIKSKNPKAKIVWPYGMMTSRANTVILNSISEAGGVENGIYSVAVTENVSGGNWHPSAQGQKVIANQIISFINNNLLEDINTHTIWQADPYLAGFSEGDTISFSSSSAGYTSKIKAIVELDSDGYYYSLDAKENGWSFVKSGVTSSELTWMNNPSILNAIAPYMQFSYDYRITSTVGSTNNLELYVWACGGWTSQLSKLSWNKPALNSNWTKVTTVPGAFGIGDTWGNGWFAFGTYGCTSYPTDGYKIDIRNIKIEIRFENRKSINDALIAAGITDVTYDTLTAYEEFVYVPIIEDTNSYTVWQAEPYLTGKSVGDTISINGNGYTASYPVKVGKNEEGFYYTVDTDGKSGWTYVLSGVGSGQSKLINNEVLTALRPYLEFSFDYRLDIDDKSVNSMNIWVASTGGWTYRLSDLYSGAINDSDGWTTVKCTPGNFTFSGDNWNSGRIAFCLSKSCKIDFRNIKLSIAGKDKVAINEALAAAGITDITYDTITGYVPYEYVNIDTPIWYANPDRSVADQGDVDVTAEVQNDKTIPVLGYSTYVYTDEEEGATFYRTIMDCQNGGSHSINTYFTSGIAANNAGFGWMANTNVIAALKPYMYIGYEYRFQSAGNIPSKPVMFMQAANWGTLTTVTTQTIVAGSWQVVEPKPLNSAAFAGTTFGSYDAKNWKDGKFMISLYGNGESFSGTQIIDIRNLRVSISGKYRLKINEALSKVAGIDEIANFTLGVELGTDANGNKDYFALLSTTEKATKYDLNDDDRFTLKDLIRMKKYEAYIVNYMPEYIIARADSNSDGHLDSVDLAEMRKALLAK